MTTAHAFARRLGKVPVIVRDEPGFLVNRIIAMYFDEALRLLAEGVRMVGHDGANPGWRSGFMTLPAAGAGIVVLTNSGVGGRIVADIVCNWADWEDGIELPGLCDGARPIPG